LSQEALREARDIVRRIADVAIENEPYFCELDAVVGDGDFGYSLARGFSQLLESWDELDYEDISGLLLKSATVLSGRIGGTSGPIWGTAFLRAGVALKGTPSPTGQDVVAALRAAIEGIKQRGNADIGDKTLLDALIPAVDRLDERLSTGADGASALAASASAAREGAESTLGMLAQRGRAAYSGERSRASVDAGAIAVAVIFEAISELRAGEATL
jgi:phosphoenolpyruvate---glycerone phosphotransferase subunit DhaL